MQKLEILALSPDDVHQFKNKLCDENPIIASELRKEFAGLLTQPIWDVGSGEGDIAVVAFPSSRVLQLEPLSYPKRVIPSSHVRVEQGFFEYDPSPEWRPGTLLFCHSLQFLDDDPNKLTTHVEKLSPKHILTVMNDLDGKFGVALNWVRERCAANPEIPVPGFPSPSWREIKRHSFSATIHSKDYLSLATGLLYVHDVPSVPALQGAYAEFLSTLYPSPTVNFLQHFGLYEK